VSSSGKKIKVALTVAGSDSGGGAGIEADLKTFHALGVFGTCAITCLTAQNPLRVSAVEAASPAIVAEQMERVLEAFPVRAAKTGMLYNAAIIEAVAAAFRHRKFRRLVVDPVMVASSGARLLKPEAVAALTKRLLPLALVATPNRAEAEVLWGRSIRSLAEQREAARELADRLGAAVIVKGGHLDGEKRAVDVLFDGRELHEFAAARVRGIKTHGTGCTFSAALAGHLALGCSLVEAAALAKKFVTTAIRSSIRVGRFQALNV
jgi:hydroxymethylpyrimidine/phosphomethylpyrimidine kinase